ncbi:MAG: ATP-binding protein [Anaerolineales bacterium]|nr:ATP-binding protein [Anaerolineales bacterium]
MNEQQTIGIALPSELGYEKVATSAIATLAHHMGFSPERVDDLKTALSEAVINSIEHGNQLNDELKVEIIALIEYSALTLKIIDQGQQPLPNLNLVRQERADHRGWGLYLIKSLVDEVKALVTPGRNELQIKLYVSP